MEPVWVSGDLKAEQVNKESIYVLENFDSPPFKLLAKKCRLVGPGVVLAHLQRGLVRSIDVVTFLYEQKKKKKREVVTGDEQSLS